MKPRSIAIMAAVILAVNATKNIFVQTEESESM